jgi:hypothetical protein
MSEHSLLIVLHLSDVTSLKSGDLVSDSPY